MKSIKSHRRAARSGHLAHTGLVLFGTDDTRSITISTVYIPAASFVHLAFFGATATLLYRHSCPTLEIAVCIKIGVAHGTGD